jgi:hypothetical protein
MGNDTLVTIAFVFRERFSATISCLEHLLDTTAGEYRLICVDGGSPEFIAASIRQLASEYGFTLIRSDDYLSPNESRNLALQQVQTRYVVFVDNDVEVGEGWLEPLVACAEETGAWLVSPLYMELCRGEKRIHMFGGVVKDHNERGRPVFYEKHQLQHSPAKQANGLVRQPTLAVEFHTLLMNMDAYRTLGPLDEKLYNTGEHADLSLAVRKAGKQIYLEPASVITHQLPYGCLKSFDRPLFALRWSEAWTQATLERLAEKYGIPCNEEGLQGRRSWVRLHRQRVLAEWPGIERLFGHSVHATFRKHIGEPLERRLNIWRYPYVDYVDKRSIKPTTIVG